MEQHFLDANVVIGWCMSWDLLSGPVSIYLSRVEAEHHSSRRAYKEAQGVLEGGRREIIKFLKKFKTIPRGGNPVRINTRINRFLEDFFRSYNGNRGGMIRAYIMKHRSDLQSYVMEVDDLDNVEGIVYAAIDEVLKSIDRNCIPDTNAPIRRHDTCPSSYTGFFPSECSMLNSIIKYPNDEMILLDAHYISRYILSEPVVFLTADKQHILNNRVDIVRILGGMTVTSPLELIRA